MPAASDPALPLRIRPLGIRVVGIAGCIFLFACFTALWLLLPSSVREDFDIFQRITAILFGVGILACFWALVRSRVDLTERGLVVVNGYKTRSLEWAQVVAIRLPQGAPWATLDLADGTTCSVMALQGSDGVRAHEGVRIIRAYL